MGKYRDELLRTDECFERHNISRFLQEDRRESELFSGGNRAWEREEDFLAREELKRKRFGKVVPRLTMYTIREQTRMRSRNDYENSLFSSEESLNRKERE